MIIVQLWQDGKLLEDFNVEDGDDERDTFLGWVDHLVDDLEQDRGCTVILHRGT